MEYCKSPIVLDIQNVCYNQPKIQAKRSFCKEICSNLGYRMANSEDPDQAPIGSALFQQKK